MLVLGLADLFELGRPDLEEGLADLRWTDLGLKIGPSSSDRAKTTGDFKVPSFLTSILVGILIGLDFLRSLSFFFYFDFLLT